LAGLRPLGAAGGFPANAVETARKQPINNANRIFFRPLILHLISRIVNPERKKFNFKVAGKAKRVKWVLFFLTRTAAP
jgi:hypothetical protein